VTCGNGAGAGSELIYTLPASAYGYDVTNITVIGGWQDNGRDAQAYTVFYSTAEDPEFFHWLASVDYNPPVPPGIASGTQVTLSDSAGQPIAANVAALQFDFTSPGVENGYAGYGAIYVQGHVSTNVITPPPLVAP